MKEIDWDDVFLEWPSDIDIARDLGVSRQTVHHQRTSRGIEKRPPRPPREPIDWEQVDWRFTDKYLGSVLFVSGATVKKHRPRVYKTKEV